MDSNPRPIPNEVTVSFPRPLSDTHTTHGTIEIRKESDRERTVRGEIWWRDNHIKHIKDKDIIKMAFRPSVPTRMKSHCIIKDMYQYFWGKYRVMDEETNVLGEYGTVVDAKSCIQRLYEKEKRRMYVVDTKGTVVYEHKEGIEPRPIVKKERVQIVEKRFLSERPMW